MQLWESKNFGSDLHLHFTAATKRGLPRAEREAFLYHFSELLLASILFINI